MPDTKKKDAKKNNSKPVKPEAPMTSEAALQAVMKEIEALTPPDLATINLDIPQAVSQALGVIPNLAEYRSLVVNDLPNQPIHSFDKLQTYTLAAYHAHILWLPPESSDNRVATLLTEATPLRGNLLSDAEALARRGLLSSDAVAAIRADRGNIDTANDLVALSALFLSHWDTIKDKTAATMDEVRRAGELGPLFLAALGVRSHGVALPPDAAAEQRRRAYTLFVGAYDEARRAIIYLRWHEGDADLIIPSLYKGRGGARPKEEAQPQAPAAEKIAATTEAGGAVTTADAKGVDAKAADAKADEKAAAPAAEKADAAKKKGGG